MNELLISVIKEDVEREITVLKENPEQIIGVKQEYSVNGYFPSGGFLIIDCENATTEHNYIIEGGDS